MVLNVRQTHEETDVHFDKPSFSVIKTVRTKTNRFSMISKKQAPDLDHKAEVDVGDRNSKPLAAFSTGRSGVRTEYIKTAVISRAPAAPRPP
ncbi:hypothetical protein EVAR_54105_1 [Eumeta japonica]|uniref:Uncharacterized protein n=1 Tax=Eumeta variegata TaxID=151549 RepID=A0A4C1YX22_EUMVA|nr:hypothetical protein EVAR_54105_1 [Eumeta japonica]